MRGDPRVIHSNARLHSVLNPLGHYEIIVGVVIAGWQGRGENDPLDSRRETRRKEFRRDHVEISSNAPRSATHLKLLLEMVKDHPINRARTLLPVLQVHREANEAASDDPANARDADAMSYPLVNE